MHSSALGICNRKWASGVHAWHYVSVLLSAIYIYAHCHFPNLSLYSLGADIIYDPSCLPHLVRVLAILLNQRKAYSQTWKDSWRGSLLDNTRDDVEVNNAEGKVPHACNSDNSTSNTDQNAHRIYPCRVEELDNTWAPMAYIASVIRNIETFSYFLELAEQANLIITDLSETRRPFDLLPHMQSYNRSSIHLFTVACK